MKDEKNLPAKTAIYINPDGLALFIPASTYIEQASNVYIFPGAGLNECMIFKGNVTVGSNTKFGKGASLITDKDSEIIISGNAEVPRTTTIQAYRGSKIWIGQNAVLLYGPMIEADMNGVVAIYGHASIGASVNILAVTGGKIFIGGKARVGLQSDLESSHTGIHAADGKKIHLTKDKSYIGTIEKPKNFPGSYLPKKIEEFYVIDLHKKLGKWEKT